MILNLLHLEGQICCRRSGNYPSSAVRELGRDGCTDLPSEEISRPGIRCGLIKWAYPVVPTYDLLLKLLVLTVCVLLSWWRHQSVGTLVISYESKYKWKAIYFYLPSVKVTANIIKSFRRKLKYMNNHITTGGISLKVFRKEMNETKGIPHFDIFIILDRPNEKMRGNFKSYSLFSLFIF